MSIQIRNDIVPMPNYPKYGITRDGCVFNLKTGRKMAVNIRNGYSA